MMLLAAVCHRLRTLSYELGLPHDERELTAFVSGMVWAFVIYIGLLIGVSWVTARAFGWPL